MHAKKNKNKNKRKISNIREKIEQRILVILVLKMSKITIPSWRQKSVEYLDKYLPTEIASRIEQALYADLQRNEELLSESRVFQQIYNYRVRDFKFLFNPASSCYQGRLVDMLKNGTMSPAQFVVMEPWQMCPESWATVMADYEKELSNMSVSSQATSEMFKCMKCGKNETTYYEEQTRSADEPMTTYINCINCGNHWKQ